jgi:hypothetical protein
MVAEVEVQEKGVVEEAEAEAAVTSSNRILFLKRVLLLQQT